METSTEVGRRVLTSTRLLWGVSIVVGVFLGYRGLSEFLPGQGFWDLGYNDLQLFVLSSTPLDQPGPYPVGLAVARFLLPAATLYAIFEATRAVFARQVQRWWLRSVRRGHVIVTGRSNAALTLIERLTAGGARVVAVPQAGVEELRAAGVAGARALYACADNTGDSTANVSTALAAVEIGPRRPRGRSLRVYAQVDDATLALALRARRLGLGTADKDSGYVNDVDFFNVDELAAGAIIDEAAVTIAAGTGPQILIAGGGPFGRAAIVAYAHRWRLLSPRRFERVTVTLVDPAAAAVVTELRSRWDIIDEVLDLRPAPGDLAGLFRAAPALRPHRAYICYEDEDLALREALTVAALWRGGPASVVVRLSRLHRHGDAFQAQSGRPLLDDLGGRLRLEGVTKLACADGVVESSLVDRLAQAIHEQYLLEQYRAGVSTGAAFTPWSQLSEEFRQANRAQAHDIGVKLAQIGCTVAPRVGEIEPFAFTPDEVEKLSIHEHERWSAERIRAGWRYGVPRDDRRRIHPSLVDWSGLDEAEREKDRNTVRLLPRVLAEVGLLIARLTG